MEINHQTGLVLEGGGMRGVFTSGVLDALMKHAIYFRYVAAVSAGACNGMSYVSRQPRRARIANIDYLSRYHYIGLRHLAQQGCIFDRDLLYNKFPNQLIPVDFDEYFQHADTFEVVTTNCLTGRAMYLTETQSRQRAIDILRASSSLPYVSSIVTVDGIPMLDGGIVDSIPVTRAISQGHATNVVVLTRNKGWRDTSLDLKQPRFVYRQYPRLRLALSRRHEVYNQQIDLVDRLEAEGKIVCIRPIRPLEVGRMEIDVEKLERLYQEGFDLGEAFAQQYFG